MKFSVTVLLVVLALCPCSVFGQQKPPQIAPAEALKDGKWEEIDQRLIFLMVRLANVEASLDAVENTIAKSSGKRASRLGEVKRAEKGNELMDRKGGGPVKWSEFYGRTAEKFFYHPVDPNTYYHTATVLRQNGPEADNKEGGGVPASQGLPVHQRPPQFDYIYRANQNAKARAEEEAAELRDKIDDLVARRTVLEAEQSSLWCEVAFRAVGRHDLARKALYRFEPASASVESSDVQRAAAMKAAVIFMRIALSIVAEAQKDQAKAFGTIKVVVANAREEFDDSWVRQAVLASDMTDMKTPPGKFVALAKRLDDVAANLSDSYEVSIDADRFKDEQRKDTFRGLLQDSLVTYAEIVLALDEMSLVMADEWKIKPDLTKPFQLASVVTETPPVVPKTIVSAEKSDGPAIPRIDSKLLKTKFGGKASYNSETGELRLAYDFRNANELKDFDLKGFNPAVTNGGLLLDGGMVIEHVVKFRTVVVGTDVLVKDHSDLIRMAGGPFISIDYSGERCTLRNGRDEAKSGPLGKGRPMSIRFFVDETRCGVDCSAAHLVLKATKGQAGKLTLEGGKSSAFFDTLLFSGIPDSDWLDNFLAE